MTEAETGLTDLQAKEYQGVQTTIRNWKRKGRFHTWCLQRENGPADKLDFGLLASRTEHIIFVVLNHPICGTFS